MLLSLALCLPLSALAKQILVQSPHLSLVLNADEGKQPEYVYFGSKLSNADLQSSLTIANSCSSILGGISNSAYSWGADICIEMASGINNNAWRVTNAASNLANAVSNIVGFSIPKEGPLSDADEYMPDFMKLMAEGLRKSSKVLVASVRELASSVGGAFTGIALPEIGAGQLAMAGAGGGSVVNNTRSIGSLQVVVNGYNARNDNDLADTVVHRINEMLNEDSRVWGK